jgi:hypothetical protein
MKKKLTISLVAILALATTALLAGSVTGASARKPCAHLSGPAKKKCLRRHHRHQLADPTVTGPSAPIAALLQPTTLTITHCPSNPSTHGTMVTMSGGLSPDSGGTPITMTVQDNPGAIPTDHIINTAAGGSWTYTWNNAPQTDNLTATARFAGDSTRGPAEVNCTFDSN